jgi:serine O-acetyltransferase
MDDTLSCWQLIKTDVVRYTGSPTFHFWKTVRAIYHHEGLLFGVLFRMCQAILKIRVAIVRLPLKFIVVLVLYRFLSIVLGIFIHLDARIGRGFYIGHFGGIFIGPVRIGNCCNISQGVIIGQGMVGKLREGLPTIGDRVYMAPGANIFGQIAIGNDVSIGANAVVSKNIPDNSIVVGNPGRIVGQQATNVYIHNAFE